MYKIIMYGIFFLYSSLTSALVPLESALLGDLTQKYQEEVDNPLNYIFNEKIKNTPRNTEEIRQLAIYKGFYFEGRNLVNSCKDRKRPLYTNSWDQVQVKRSIYASLQYLGLDLTSRALPIYAKYFKFDKDEYTNLIKGLVGNYCSVNISTLSRSHIIKNFLLQYDTSKFILPSIEGNPLFNKKLQDIGNPNSNRKKEFYYTMELFKRFCSWGGEDTQPRLLVPLIKNPVSFAFITRQMSNRSLAFDTSKNKTITYFNKNTVQVHCQNLICRKKSSAKFWKSIKLSVGSDSLTHDMEGLYCSGLRDIDYKYKEQPKKLVDFIKKTSLDEEVFTVSQFLSLLTGIPDLLMRSENFSDIKVFAKSSMDKSLKDWSMAQNEKYNKTIHYEESITIETSERKHYFNSKIRKFAVEFEVNLGEYDRITQRVGKIRAGFRLKIPKKLLKWAIDNYSNHSAKKFVAVKKEVLARLKETITPQVIKAQKKFLRSPLKGDLTKLILNELSIQLSVLKAENYQVTEVGYEIIPIKIHYGFFALKYLNYKHKVDYNKKRDEYLSSIFKTN